jgi:hypothetical protein
MIVVDSTRCQTAKEQIEGQQKLQRWHDMPGRQGRVQELKREINALCCRRPGEARRYPGQEEQSDEKVFFIAALFAIAFAVSLRRGCWGR